MKKVKKILCVLLVAVICLSSAPLVGFDFTAEAADYQVGDIIQFGSYPQSEVKDESLIADLNALAPQWDDWTSYGYYSGNGDIESMVPGDWMRYTDIIYNGTKYRGVKFTQYRPMSTGLAPSSADSVQDEMGYHTNEIYWFKFESISWQILDPDTGFVVSKTLLDAQPYSNTVYANGSGDGKAYNTPSLTTYANHYETSSIRKWLHGNFYNTAFTDNEKEKISTTTIDNDGYARLSGQEQSWLETFGDDIELSNYNKTQDKVFLLSYNETPDKNLAKGSNYAHCQGLAEELTGALWILRTGGVGPTFCCLVGGDEFQGDMQGRMAVFGAFGGIRPALKFIDITDIDTPTDNPTPDDPTPDDPEPDKPENTAGIIIDSDIYAVKVYGVETSKIFTVLDSNLDFDKVTAWDIVLTVDGVETQPEGKVTVRIPVPVGYNAEKCKVYHIDPETGKLTDMNARVENGYFVFVTDHFSIYSVVELHEHSFGDKDAECSCGFDRTEGCSCNCHKDGIAGFFFKIILFFQKLFKANQVCDCGIAHY